MNFEYQLRFVIFDEKPGARKEQHWETTYEDTRPIPPLPENIRHNGKGGAIMPVRAAMANHETAVGLVLMAAFAPAGFALLLAGIINYASAIIHLFV